MHPHHKLYFMKWIHASCGHVGISRCRGLDYCERFTAKSLIRLCGFVSLTAAKRRVEDNFWSFRTTEAASFAAVWHRFAQFKLASRGLKIVFLLCICLAVYAVCDHSAFSVPQVWGQVKTAENKSSVLRRGTWEKIQFNRNHHSVDRNTLGAAVIRARGEKGAEEPSKWEWQLERKKNHKHPREKWSHEMVSFIVMVCTLFQKREDVLRKHSGLSLVNSLIPFNYLTNFAYLVVFLTLFSEFT